MNRNETKRKNRHAVAMAKARAKSLTPARRKEIAANAGKARWAKARRA